MRSLCLPITALVSGLAALHAAPDPARAEPWQERGLHERAYLYDTSSILLHLGAGDRNEDAGIAMRLYGVEAGAFSGETHDHVLERDPLDDTVIDRGPVAESKGWFIGASPFTYGSWFHGEDDPISIAYAQPFVRYQLTETTHEGARSTDSSVVVGARSFLIMPFYRMGLEASVEAGGHPQSDRASIAFVFGSGNAPVPFGDDDAGSTPASGIRGTLNGFAGIVALGLLYGAAGYVCDQSASGC